VSVGATVATVIWLIASVGFSLYVQTFGNYAKTYGSLAAVVVLVGWTFYPPRRAVSHDRCRSSWLVGLLP